MTTALPTLTPHSDPEVTALMAALRDLRFDLSTIRDAADATGNLALGGRFQEAIDRLDSHRKQVEWAHERLVFSGRLTAQMHKDLAVAVEEMARARRGMKDVETALRGTSAIVVQLSRLAAILV